MYVKFSEKQTFRIPCVCVSGDKKLTFRKFTLLCFLETPVLRFALLLITDKVPFYDVFSKYLCSFSKQLPFSPETFFRKMMTLYHKFSFCAPPFFILNNPSRGQSISVFVNFLGVVFHRIKKPGKMLWSVKVFNFKKLRLKLAHNDFLCKHRIWVVHKKVYSFKSRLINYNAVFFCNVTML